MWFENSEKNAEYIFLTLFLENFEKSFTLGLNNIRTIVT